MEITDAAMLSMGLRLWKVKDRLGYLFVLLFISGTEYYGMTLIIELG